MPRTTARACTKCGQGITRLVEPKREDKRTGKLKRSGWCLACPCGKYCQSPKTGFFNQAED